VLPLTPQAYEERTTRIERVSPEWRSGALPSELRPPSGTPGWSRTSGLCRRRTALSPLSYGRTKEPPAGIEPAPRPYKGRVLAVDTTEAKWRRSESNRHLPRCKRGARPVELHPRVRTGGVEPPQHEATGLQPAELAVAQRPRGSEGGRPGSNRRQRGSQPRVLPSTPRPPRSGDDRTRTGGLSPDKRVLCASELRPRRKGGRRDRLPATGDRDVAV
jgi:hypothetical protein